jgi:selenide, water dikinase
MSIVAWPVKLGLEGLGRVLEGAADVAREAGVAIIGGHSVDDPAPKFGLVAIGVVDEARLAANKGAKPGDVLYLTKPIGSGLMTGALKKGRLTRDEIREVVETMTTLNRRAAEAMNEVGVRAATDVTGFGLLGHLQKMMLASETSARVATDRVPLLSAARRLAEEGQAPGGARRNLDYFGAGVEWTPQATEADKLIVADPQTSGGILACVASENAAAFEEALRTRGVPVHRIGEVCDGRAGAVRFL